MTKGFNRTIIFTGLATVATTTAFGHEVLPQAAMAFDALLNAPEVPEVSQNLRKGLSTIAGVNLGLLASLKTVPMAVEQLEKFNER